MPVRELRRLDSVVNDSLFDQIEAMTLHQLTARTFVDALERDQPELIIRDGKNMLAAEWHGGAKLIYGFEHERAFVDRFPRMFEKLLPKVRRVLHADSLRFRLSYAPARPLIEPLLKQLWFRPSRDWMEFSLARSAKLPAAPAPRGVRFRDGVIDDVPELIRIDRQAFPDTPIPTEAMRARLQDGESAIIAMAGKDVAGFCIFDMPDEGEGWISVLAISEEHRGRGIGAALTVRAAKRLFAGGARTVGLTTDDDNSAAIRLYVRLGFRQTRAGRDYSRPTDPRAIAEMKRAGEGTFIRFGGWR
jgi:[ribosomal protein S18]-alanine N-acetyltransferase